MSWDVLVQAAKSPPPKVSEMPKDWVGIPLGKPQRVREKISKALPAVAWDSPDWGRLDQALWSIEFNIGHNDPCDSVMLHIRGSNEDGTLAQNIQQLLAKTGWYALDLVQSEWMHHAENPVAGLMAFNDFLAHAKKPLWKRWLGL